MGQGRQKAVVVESSFEHIVDEDEEEEDITPCLISYKAIFEDHGCGDGAVLNPRSILRMRVEKKEAAWSELRF